MSSTADTIQEIVGITTTVISGISGNLPAIASAINFLLEAYDEIIESPGEFDLDDFQQRINALPDYSIPDEI